MSRSRRKTPVTGITSATTEKQEKREANRKLRRQTREQLKTQPTHEPLPELREVSNTWAMSKDGKRYVDADAHPKVMRK
ncbi:MAG: hypothetical protein RhofKO_19710 [Rhodothermales bacterium]